MVSFAVTQLDPASQFILSMCLSILSFFTVLFHSWKFLRPKAFLNEMIQRTHSWWVILFLYILFFCIDSRFGFVGLGMLALLCVRELVGKVSPHQLPMSQRNLVYLLIPFQFYLASQGNVFAVAATLPAAYFLLSVSFSLFVGRPDAIVSGPSMGLWSLLLTTYGLSHLALLLSFSQWPASQAGSLSGLLLYYLFLVQFNDVLQFLWGAIFGRHKILPAISPKKTWEGLLGGLATTIAVAYLLRFLTPFDEAQSLIVGALLSLTGFMGDLTLSAFKRNMGLKDMGSLIPGHGGLLDRLDSITLSSLVYFYLIFYWFQPWSV